MKAILLAWWDERNPREKRMLSIGLLVILLALFYNVLIAPAWTGSDAIRASLPAMKQQLAAMENEADEAKRLGSTAHGIALNGDSLSSAVTSSLADRGLNAADVKLVGSAVQVDLKRVSFSRWIGWVDDMRKQLKVQVSAAHIAPIGGGDRRVDVRVLLAPAGDMSRDGASSSSNLANDGFSGARGQPTSLSNASALRASK